MELSARNQLKSTVKSIELGKVMAEVVLELSSGEEIVAVITRHSAERLNLVAGEQVVAIVKSTEVLVGK